MSFIAHDGTAPRPTVRDKMTKVTHFNLNSGNYDAMRAYMRDRFPFLGIQTPVRRAALKPLLDAAPDVRIYQAVLFLPAGSLNSTRQLP